MSIKFGGKTIKGTHGLAEKGSTQLLRLTADFWALHGRLEMIGGRTGRPITVEILIYAGYAKARTLEKDLRIIESMIGHHGRLELTDDGETPDTYETFNHCTFTQLERLSLGNRVDTGPVYDYAGTVDGGWCQLVKLHFEQLRVPVS